MSNPEIEFEKKVVEYIEDKHKEKYKRITTANVDSFEIYISNIVKEFILQKRLQANEIFVEMVKSKMRRIKHPKIIPRNTLVIHCHGSVKNT